MSTTPPYSNPPAPATPPASMVDHDALPAGTRFGEFEILRVLGVGGFGIVYLAMDHSLQRQVALKEYMPAALASRGQGPQITVRSGSFAETYAIGLRSFVNEARLLARFDHPSLVKVYRFWEDNATAYMVMPYLQGSTLREARRAMTEPPGEAWIRSVLDPLLGALEQLHREGVFHRDIAPDNIVLPPNGPPVLLDFGAARHVISDRTQSLTAILKPSYAPIEQYAEMTQLRQGPWTDLYALGAVMHFVLTGAPPAPATARAVQDDAQALEDRNIPGVSARFLAAISWMLAVRPQARPQNVETLRAALDGRIGIPMNARAEPATPPAAAPGSAAFEPTIRVDALASMPAPASTAHQPTVRVPPPSASVTAPVMRGIAAAQPPAPVPQTLPPAPAPAPAIQPTPPLAASASPLQSAAGAAADSGKSSSKVGVGACASRRARVATDAANAFSKPSRRPASSGFSRLRACIRRSRAWSRLRARCKVGFCNAAATEFGFTYRRLRSRLDCPISPESRHGY